MDNHSGSAPPSEPPPNPRARTDSFPALEGPATPERATRIAEGVRRDFRVLEKSFHDFMGLVGTLPTAVNPMGTGAFGVLFTSLATFGSKLDEVADGLAADRAAAAMKDKARGDELAVEAKRREPWSRAGWIVFGTVLSFVTLAACTGVGAYLALHWRGDPAPAQQGEQRR